MTDDPRELLKDVEVECPELEGFVCWMDTMEAHYAEVSDDEVADRISAAIIALAKLVHEAQWKLDSLIGDDPGFGLTERTEQELDRRYAEHMKGRDHAEEAL
jgi:hypothetical protein